MVLGDACGVAANVGGVGLEDAFGGLNADMAACCLAATSGLVRVGGVALLPALLMTTCLVLVAGDGGPCSGKLSLGTTGCAALGDVCCEIFGSGGGILAAANGLGFGTNGGTVNLA